MRKKTTRGSSVPRRAAPSTKKSKGWKQLLTLKFLLPGFLVLLILGLLVFGLVDWMQDLRMDASGNIVTDHENWLVINIGSSSNPRYRKLAEINAAPGYTLEKSDYTYDPNQKIYYFLPVEDPSPLQRYYVMTANGSHDQLAQVALQNITTTGAEEHTQVLSGKASGRGFSYYRYTYTNKDTTSQKTLSQTQAVNVYVDFGHYTVLFVLEETGGESRLDEAGLLELMERLLSGLQKG